MYAGQKNVMFVNIINENNLCCMIVEYVTRSAIFSACLIIHVCQQQPAVEQEISNVKVTNRDLPVILAP